MNFLLSVCHICSQLSAFIVQRGCRGSKIEMDCPKFCPTMHWFWCFNEASEMGNLLSPPVCVGLHWMSLLFPRYIKVWVLVLLRLPGSNNASSHYICSSSCSTLWWLHFPILISYLSISGMFCSSAISPMFSGWRLRYRGCNWRSGFCFDLGLNLQGGLIN